MSHDIGRGFDAAHRYCRAHGGPAAACNWIHRLKGVVVTGVTAATIGGLGGRDAAAWFGLVGAAAGFFYPELAEAIQASGLDEASHSFGG